jgi:heptosyltransferase III
MSGKPRILAIRGGAIGDFLLTLPALRLVRENFGHCHLEILGYRHIAELAVYGGPVEGQTYADAVKNIEAAPLAGFFARNGDLDQQWCDYFASFQQVISWLFDPDKILENNLKRAGVRHYLSAYARIHDEDHASAQWAHGLQSMAMYLDDPVSRLIPTPEMRKLGVEWLDGQGYRPDQTLIALHPGSGSPKKNWPIAHWRELAKDLASRGRLLIIGGEADAQPLAELVASALGSEAIVARDLPLPLLAAVLIEADQFIGHDTGVSHLAAAVGVPSTLMFGPTDPSVWAPRGEHVRIVSAPAGDLGLLPVGDVVAQLR